MRTIEDIEVGLLKAFVVISVPVANVTLNVVTTAWQSSQISKLVLSTLLPFDRHDHDSFPSKCRTEKTIELLGNSVPNSPIFIVLVWCDSP
jgi:hypothetical protein